MPDEQDSARYEPETSPFKPRRMKSHIEEQFAATGLTERIGAGHFFATVDEAVAWCDDHRSEMTP